MFGALGPRHGGNLQSESRGESGGDVVIVTDGGRPISLDVGDGAEESEAWIELGDGLDQPGWVGAVGRSAAQRCSVK